MVIKKFIHRGVLYIRRILRKLANRQKDEAAENNLARMEVLSDQVSALSAKLDMVMAAAVDAESRSRQESVFRQRLLDLRWEVESQLRSSVASGESSVATQVEGRRALRRLVRESAGLSQQTGLNEDSAEDLLMELKFLHAYAPYVKSLMTAWASKRVLYAGQAYYNAWYLSRELRKLGWKADVLNWDINPKSQIYYHGEDFEFYSQAERGISSYLAFYVDALYTYDVFHFSNAHGISFGWKLDTFFADNFSQHEEIRLLRAIGKKIVYSNSGCLDGVSQTSFEKWGPESPCSVCIWRDQPLVCSDARNLAWGEFRNSVSDYQCLLGGNRVDYNRAATVHESPEFYCLDPEFWSPDLQIPEAYRLQERSGVIRLYHAVGNLDIRTSEHGVNIKSSHIYLPLVDRLRGEGLVVELLAPSNVPNKEVRYIQAQADIFLEMLTFGWYGANAREAMMLGKPVVCYIRPDWLESVRREIPEYAAELPIISATPSTVESVLRELIADPEKRAKIGAKSRAFAVKWHSSRVAAQRFDSIYTRLLSGDPILLSDEQMESFHA